MATPDRPVSTTGKEAFETALRPTWAVRALPWVVGVLAAPTVALLLAMSFLAAPRGALGLLLVLAAFMVAGVGTLGFLGARGLVVTDRASRQARHADPSSGAASMSYFENACRQVQQSGQPFGLVVIRISGSMNAPFAEDTGEEAAVLRWAAEQARVGTRGTDLVGRLPGLRLGILLQGPLNRDTADVVLDRLKQRLDPQAASIRRAEKVQVRLGVAIGKPTGPLTDLLAEAADKQVVLRALPSTAHSPFTVSSDGPLAGSSDH